MDLRTFAVAAQPFGVPTLYTPLPQSPRGGMPQWLPAPQTPSTRYCYLTLPTPDPHLRCCMLCVGEFINRFQRGSLVMKLPDAEVATFPTMLYAT